MKGRNKGSTQIIYAYMGPIEGFGFRDIATAMENQMEQKMENEMDYRIIDRRVTFFVVVAPSQIVFLV